MKSVGKLINKLLAINPKLSSPELIDIIRQSTTQYKSTNEFDMTEVIDEAKAIALVQAFTRDKKVV